MSNILWMIILIIILLIIILHIGVKINIKYNKTADEIKGCLKILVLKKIKIKSIIYPINESEQDKTENKDLKKIYDLSKPCLDDFKNFLTSIKKSVTLNKLQNHLIFGLEDYAKTGEYIGIIWSVLAVANTIHENIILSAEPSFKGSTLDLNGEIDIDINILKLIIPALKLVSKKEVRTLIRGVRNG